MLHYIIRCLLKSALVVLLMTMLIFVVGRVGGDPLLKMLPITATQQDRINLAAKLGLDRSLPEQYWAWLSSVLRGDLGKSILMSIPVMYYVKAFAPNTVKLSAYALGFVFLIGVPLGVAAALRRETAIDILVRTTAILGQSAPMFWIGLLLMYFFAIKFHLFPILGGGGGWGAVLPVATLVFYMLPGVMRLTRSAMIETLSSDYITFARAKGLSEFVVVFKHALKNALIPIVTFSGMWLSILMSGMVIVEVVFAWPGIGLCLFKAGLGGDYPVLQGTVLLITVAVVFINLVVDVLNGFLDPRIRHLKL